MGDCGPSVRPRVSARGSRGGNGDKEGSDGRLWSRRQCNHGKGGATVMPTRAAWSDHGNKVRGDRGRGIVSEARAAMVRLR